MRRHHFRVRTCKRTYDRTTGKFSFNISYETTTKVTPRSIVVAEAFGLGMDETRRFKVLDAELKIGPKDVVYITGDTWQRKKRLAAGHSGRLGGRSNRPKRGPGGSRKTTDRNRWRHRRARHRTAKQSWVKRCLSFPAHLQSTE